MVDSKRHILPLLGSVTVFAKKTGTFSYLMLYFW